MIYRVKGPELSSAAVILWKSRLDGVTYNFKLTYAERYDAWYIDIGTASGEWILQGFRVVEGTNLLQAFTSEKLPTGALRCIDTQGQGANPTRDDWKERHLLTYEPKVVAEEDDGITAQIIEGFG